MTTGSELGEALAAYTPSGYAHGGATGAALQALREAILDGALSPGTRLLEGELCSALGLSRTPVRSAISQLVEEGLAVKSSNATAAVAELTIEDVMALYVVREHLEGLAARLAAAHRDAGLLADLEDIGRAMAALGEGRAAELARLNLVWHRRLREAAGNAYLDRFLGQVEQAVRRLPVSTFDQPGRAAEVVAEHGRVLAALGEGDRAGAEQAAREHMRHAREARLHELLGE